MKRLKKLSLGLFVGLFGFTAGAPAQAELTLSQSPLFLITPVQPALVMAVDDSASMDAEVLFDTDQGVLHWNRTNGFTLGGEPRFDGRLEYRYLFPNGDGSDDGRRLTDDMIYFAVPPLPQFAYARSPEFNSVYFDPATEYPPWPSEGTKNFSDATPTAAEADPVRGTQTWDLTQQARDSHDITRSNWTFRFMRNMTIPPGTFVKRADVGSCISNNDWVTPTSPFTLNSRECNIAVDYFPATFWLKETSPAPDGFTGTAITGGKAPDGSAMVGYEIKPGNFSNYDEMIQKFANWFQYYRKRLHLARAAMGRSFADTNFLRLGFTTINLREDVDMKDLSVQGDREEYFDWQYDLRPRFVTPNKQAVRHIGEQFEIDGDNAPILEACQLNLGLLVTDGFYTDNDESGVGNADGEAGSPLAGTVLADSKSDTLADFAYSFYNTRFRASDFDAGQVPVPSACSQDNPPLTLDCNKDLHMNFFAVMLGAKGDIFGRDERATEDPFNNPPPWPTSIGRADPSTVDDVWHATLNTRGEAFSADRPDELVQALSSVLGEIASRIEPVGVSATSTRLDEDTQFFESELDSTTWSGNLKAINANTGSVNWNAESELPGPGSRAIKTSINGTPRNFEVGPGGVTDDMRIDMFGNDSSDPAERERQNMIINYLRGDQSKEEQNGGTLRDREGVIGDIANSRPTFVGPVNEGWGRLDADYLDYIKPGSGDKQDLDLVLVGANAGMLHAFDSDSGGEQFAYVPSMVHENLEQLSDPDYVHRFFVDGQVGVGDIKRGADWTTVAVAGLGAGGKGVFALDLQSEEVLWEIDVDHPDVGEHIGHVFGKPVVTRAGGEWVAVFGNGYNSEEGTAGLIVARMNGGSAEFIETDTATTDNGLSEVAVFMDPVDRLNALRAYAGDLKGNMWRFDFDGGTDPTSKFGSNPLIQADNNRAITSAPTLAALPGGGLMVFFGTGKLLETGDRTETATQFDRFYAVRDENSRFNNTSALATATMNSEDGGNRSIDGVEGATKGWVLNLGIGSDQTGERVLANPQVSFGNLIFTTFEPVDDPCAPGGTRRIYLLNALNASGQFDSECNNCGVIEVGLGAPIDPAIVIRPPPTGDRFDDENPPPPFDPGGELPGADTVGAVTRWCSTLLIQVAGEGQVPIGNICDGRQVWRQSR